MIRVVFTDDVWLDCVGGHDKWCILPEWRECIETVHMFEGEL